MRNGAKRRFWDHAMWGGGVVANREPGSYIGDEKLPSYVGIILNHKKDPYCFMESYDGDNQLYINQYVGYTHYSSNI